MRQPEGFRSAAICPSSPGPCRKAILRLQREGGGCDFLNCDFQDLFWSRLNVSEGLERVQPVHPMYPVRFLRLRCLSLLVQGLLIALSIGFCLIAVSMNFARL